MFWNYRIIQTLDGSVVYMMCIMKFAFLKDKKIGYLNDKDDHSIKLPQLKPLDYQKHCWLLHSLYDGSYGPLGVDTSYRQGLF